jgi:putative tryptophan/tyrosine transport system substrate-binding protein
MPHRWTRRQVVHAAGAVGLGLLAGCGRLPGQAQAPKVYRVGYVADRLQGNEVSISFGAFRESMRELGYVEGQNVVYEFREGPFDQFDRLRELAAELARLPLDVIVAQGTPHALMARQATTTIPIIFTPIIDPVEAGLVASLARPGGNVTGGSLMATQLSEKRLELLVQVVPGLSRVAVLAGSRGQELALRQIEAAAHMLGLELQVLVVGGAEELEAVFDAAIRDGAGGILPLAHLVFNINARRVVELAERSRLPGSYPTRVFVEQGGLMAYTPSAAWQRRSSAYYVDRVLKGAHPADLPVEQPREFDFVVNLKTAQALGLTIPHHVLLQATEVIQ